MQRLADIDQSAFEILVASYLRQTDPGLRGLIQTGINAQGRSVAHPIDGVLLVHRTPPCCVTVQATVTQIAKLRGKWFGTSDDEGDIAKAASAMQRYERSHGDLERVLYLATNQVLSTSNDLVGEVHEAGKQVDIRIEIIEASALVHHLDLDREGQYLREAVFGIAAQRLSAVLLRDIAARSLEHHRARYAITRSSAREITRDVQSRVVESLTSPQGSLVGIVGPRGCGKSTLARLACADLLNSGLLTLWVPAEDVRDDTSIESVSLRVLQRFQPSLDARAGQDALELSGDNGITLLVDDVNRLPEPGGAIWTMETWRRLQEEAQPANQVRRPSARCLVPMWHGQLNQGLRAPVSSRTPWTLVDLADYSHAEQQRFALATDARQQASVTMLAAALNGDPLLCGLGLQVPDINNVGPALTGDILRGALREAAVQVAQAVGNVTPNEILDVFWRLGCEVLRHSQPDPDWKTLTSWLDAADIEILRALSREGQLAYISERDGQDWWQWRHDRIRDALLAQTLVGDLIQVGDDTLAHSLSDPGLAEPWALALLFADPAVRRGLIEALGESQPHSLAHALRTRLVEATDRSLCTETLTAFMRQFATEDALTAEANACLLELAQASGEEIRSIVEGLPKVMLVAAAGFRNGCMDDGVSWIKLMEHWQFDLDRFPLFADALIALSAQIERGMIDPVAALAATLTPENLTEAVILAGYLRRDNVLNVVGRAWVDLDPETKMQHLPAALWCFSRHGTDYALTLLNDALDRLVTLPWNAQRHLLDQQLFGSGDWNFQDAAVNAWVQKAYADRDAADDIFLFLFKLDQPVALRACVEWLSSEDSRWSISPRDDRDPVVPIYATHVPARADTRSALWEIVTGVANERHRRVAFDLWQRYPVPADVTLLSQTSPEDSLYPEMLKVRARLGDETAATPIADQLLRSPSEFLPFASLLCSHRGVEQTVLDVLATALDEPNTKAGTFTRHLSADSIPRLIRERGDVLARRPETWIGLWQAESAEALTFVAAQLAQAELERVRYFLQRDHLYDVRLTTAMLDSLIPFVQRLDQADLDALAGAALFQGLGHWVEEVLLPHLSQPVADRVLSRRDRSVLAFLQAAAEAVPQGDPAVRGILVSAFGRDWNLRSDVLAALPGWLGLTPTRDQMWVAAMLLEVAGSAADIEWWEAIAPDDSSLNRRWSDVLFTLRRRRWHSQVPLS